MNANYTGLILGNERELVVFGIRHLSVFMMEERMLCGILVFGKRSAVMVSRF
jgi:hypothetical protein